MEKQHNTAPQRTPCRENVSLVTMVSERLRDVHLELMNQGGLSPRAAIAAMRLGMDEYRGEIDREAVALAQAGGGRG